MSPEKQKWLESLTADEKNIKTLSHRWGVTPMGVRHWLHTPSDTYLPFYKALWVGMRVNTEPRYEQCADITAVLHEYGIGLREFSRDTGRHVVTLRGYALHERKCSMFWDLLEGYRAGLR